MESSEVAEVRLARRRAARLARRLTELHGTPDLGNKQDPLDELIFILLSQMTTGPSYERVFDRLKARMKSWESLIHCPLRTLKSIVADAGLSGQKAPRLKAIARQLKRDFGSVTLENLRGYSDAEAERYLMSLPGVGVKTAKCVMMYSLGRQVLPVDTHVRRVLVRTGLLEEDVTASELHRSAERVVRPTDRFTIHVNGLVHGRAVCRAVRPRCDECGLSRCCRTYRARAG